MWQWEMRTVRIRMRRRIRMRNMGRERESERERERHREREIKRKREREREREKNMIFPGISLFEFSFIDWILNICCHLLYFFSSELCIICIHYLFFIPKVVTIQKAEWKKNKKKQKMKIEMMTTKFLVLSCQ